MLKCIGASILCILLLTQTITPWMIWAAFKVNQSWIAKNSCENRFRPSLHCQGKCILMRKMASDNKQDLPSSVLKWSKGIEFFSGRVNYLSFAFRGAKTKTKFADLSLLYEYDPLQGIFRPPDA